MTLSRGSLIMNLPSAATGDLPYIPGDGRGSALAMSGAATTMHAATPATATGATVASSAAAAAGRLAITEDGFWATVTAVPSGTTITVDRWRSITGRKGFVPGLSKRVCFFPAGSCIAGAEALVVYEVIPLWGDRINDTLSLHDHTLAAATRVPPYTFTQVPDPTSTLTVSQSFGPHGLHFNGPFALSGSAPSHLYGAVVFSILG